MEINEQQIKEKRTFEAMQKEYIGYQGKFFRIAFNLGDEIIKQGEELNYLMYDDFWQEDKSDIKTLDENTYINTIGWAFDGLKYGNKIEIFIFDEEKKIKVTHDCKTVYEEVLGEVESYCPGDWEKHIESLIKPTIEKEIALKQKSKENAKSRFEQNKKNILNYLSERWGI